MVNTIVVVVDIGTLVVHIDNYFKSKNIEHYYKVRDDVIDATFRTILQDEFGYNIVDINVGNYTKYNRYVKLWKDSMWSKMHSIVLKLNIEKLYYLRTLIVKNKIHLRLEEID